MSDFRVGDTLYHHFSTRAFTSGIPTTLAGTPVAEAYEEASAAGITAGVSLTIDHGETGHHLLTVVATGGNSFEGGKSYGVSLTAGTVDSVSVIGEVLFNFTLEKSPAAQDLANGTDGLGAIKAETAAILADTNELQTDDVPGLIATLDSVVDTVKAETALIVADTNELQSDDVPGLIATLDTVVDTVKADTAEIGTAGAGLTNLGGMSTSMKAEVNIEADTALTDYDGPTNAEMIARTLSVARIAQLGQNLDNGFTGTASGVPTATTMVSDIVVTANNQFKGRIITFDNDTPTTALQGQSTDITACTASSNTLTFTALTNTPVSGDKFVIT